MWGVENDLAVVAKTCQIVTGVTQLKQGFLR